MWYPWICNYWFYSLVSFSPAVEFKPWRRLIEALTSQTRWSYCSVCIWTSVTTVWLSQLSPRIECTNLTPWCWTNDFFEALRVVVYSSVKLLLIKQNLMLEVSGEAGLHHWQHKKTLVCPSVDFFQAQNVVLFYIFSVLRSDLIAIVHFCVRCYQVHCTGARFTKAITHRPITDN